MPKPFTAKLGTAGPYSVRAGAESFGAITGKQMRDLGNQANQTLGVLKDRQDNEEIRRLHLKAAELRTRHAQALEDARLSGRDYDEVREEFGAELEGLNQYATSRKAIDMLNLTKEQLRLGFFGAETRHMAGRAGEQAKQQYTQYLQYAAQGLAADPSTAEEYKANLLAYTETMDEISPEARAELYNTGAADIDRAAVAQFTNINPEYVIEALKTTDAFPSLTPQQRAAALGNAEAEIDKRRRLAREARRDAIFERKERAGMAMVQFTRDIIAGGDQAQQALSGLSNHPDLSDEDVRIGLNFYRALNDEKSKPRSSNLQVMDNLFERITLPPGDDRRITTVAPVIEAFSNRQLSTADYNFLMKVFEDDKTPDGRTFNEQSKPILDEIKARVVRDTMTQADVEGRARYQRIRRDFFNNAAKLREENKDPRDLLNPQSDMFVGYWADAQPRPMKERIRGMARGAAASGEVVWVESAAEFEALQPGTRYRFRGHPEFDSETVRTK